MEITMRRVKDLKPYEKNAKKHDAKQIANVANSIKRFGWQQPLVIDENGVVVIGHCRLLAAKKLGLAEVPCTVASGLTDDEIRELFTGIEIMPMRTAIMIAATTSIIEIVIAICDTPFLYAAKRLSQEKEALLNGR